MVLIIVIGRKINYSVPDDWYFPISDHLFDTKFVTPDITPGFRTAVRDVTENPDFLPVLTF